MKIQITINNDLRWLNNLTENSAIPLLGNNLLFVHFVVIEVAYIQLLCVAIYYCISAKSNTKVVGDPNTSATLTSMPWNMLNFIARWQQSTDTCLINRRSKPCFRERNSIKIIIYYVVKQRKSFCLTDLGFMEHILIFVCRLSIVIDSQIDSVYEVLHIVSILYQHLVPVTYLNFSRKYESVRLSMYLCKTIKIKSAVAFHTFSFAIRKTIIIASGI